MGVERERERKKGRREQKKKCQLFFLSLWQSVTFFDISTEDLVLQQRLPDALIDLPVSNRKRNKCFIELELSLVIAVGKEWWIWRGQPASVWVSVQRWRVALDSQYKHFVGMWCE